MDNLQLPESFNLNEAVQVDLTKLSSMNEQDIKSAYLANLFAAYILLKIDDKMTQMILYDPQHKLLNKYSNKMSPINFWGTVFYNSKNKAFSKIMSSTVIDGLHKTAGRIFRDTMKTLHVNISTRKSIDWNEINDCFRIITLRLPMRNSRINFIREGFKNWDNLSKIEKSQVISKIFYFLMEADQNSKLLPRIRAISNAQLQQVKDDEPIEAEYEYISEEDGGDVGGADATVTSSGDVGGDVSSAFVPFRLFKNKLIKRIKRSKYNRKNKKLKKLKFKGL